MMTVQSSTKVNLSPTVLGRLSRESLFWLASVRPAGTPHLAPVRYVWHNEGLYIFTGGVKLHNLQANPALCLALQDHASPLRRQAGRTLTWSILDSFLTATLRQS